MKRILFTILFFITLLSAFSQNTFEISKLYGNWLHDDKTEIISSNGNIVERNDLILNSLFLSVITINENGLYYDVVSTTDEVSSITEYSCKDFQYKVDNLYEAKDSLHFRAKKADPSEKQSIKAIFKHLESKDFELFLIKSDCINDDFKKMYLIDNEQLIVKFQDNYYIFSLVKE